MRDTSGPMTILRVPNPDGAGVDQVRADPAFLSLVGFSERELAEEPLLDWLHPDDQHMLLSADPTKATEVFARHRTAEDGWIGIRWKLRPGRPEQFGVACPSSPLTDTELVLSGGSLREILEAMAKIVEAKNPGLRCSIVLADDAGEQFSLSVGPSLPDEYNEAIEGISIGPMVGSCGTAIYWNSVVIAENMATDPLWEELRELSARVGVAACWSTPIADSKGRILGAMALYSARPGRPTTGQLDGLEIAARMVGLAVERSRFQQQLLKAAKLEALGLLSGGIAHDFNNLLAGILGNTELILGDAPEGSQLLACARDVLTAAESAADLCRLLLVYSGQDTLEIEVVECNALIREMAGLLGAAVPKKAEMVFDLSPVPVEVKANQGQLRQVILNMITNGADALEDGNGTLRLRTRALEVTPESVAGLGLGDQLAPGSVVEIALQDDGVGMSEAQQQQMFEPFFTTKQKGVGLGLAGVRNIVGSLGGAVLVESELGVGTEFRVLLPRAGHAGGEPDKPRESTTSLEPPKGRILVAEDEEFVRKSVTWMLQEAGYDVVGVRDGEEALQVLRETDSPFDCLLIDYSMPRHDGCEVVIGARELGVQAPILIATGHAVDRVAVQLGKEKVSGFLQKPLRRATLLDAVSRALRSVDIST